MKPELPAHLLEQAVILAALDRTGRPREANLRRAVSACYYSLFHRLIELASRTIAGKNEDHRNLLRRLFEHSEMKEAAKSFSGGTLPDKIGRFVGQTVPRDLQRLAEIFVDLQEQRHAADYNLSKPWTRQGVHEIIARAREGHNLLHKLWKSKAADPEKQMLRAFFLGLLLWKRAKNSPV